MYIVQTRSFRDSTFTMVFHIGTQRFTKLQRLHCLNLDYSILEYSVPFFGFDTPFGIVLKRDCSIPEISCIFRSVPIELLAHIFFSPPFLFHTNINIPVFVFNRFFLWEYYIGFEIRDLYRVLPSFSKLFLQCCSNTAIIPSTNPRKLEIFYVFFVLFLIKSVEPKSKIYFLHIFDFSGSNFCG